MMVFPFSSTLHDPRKAQPRNQEQQVNNVPPTASAIEAATSNVDAVENGIHEEEADGYSIYIKGLPMSATPAMLDDEFKKFGTIKSNGIQVRSNRGFCFGFVEFEAPEAVKKVIEASPVVVVLLLRRSDPQTPKARGRGSFPAGRGSFRNEGVRGRGNFGSGGRGFNRGGDFGDRRNDFGGSRNEYGNKGGGRGGAPPTVVVVVMDIRGSVSTGAWRLQPMHQLFWSQRQNPQALRFPHNPGHYLLIKKSAFESVRADAVLNDVTPSLDEV
ncbi:Ras GTPase-activating protein-binding protein 1-like protein isoform X1 [Tanacetum coccineum]